MSKKIKPGLDELPLDADLVRAYLEQNVDFFVHHADLITQLRIPHDSHGAVSLLEKRQEVQRQKIIAMEEELTLLMGHARQNEVIFKAISEMYIELVGCDSIRNLEKAIDKVCRNQLYLAQFRLLQPEDEAYLHLQAKLNGNPSYLGRLNQEVIDAVFEPGAQSVALVELNHQDENDEIILGIAAFASSSALHFTPDMDTLFIDELGRLISRHAIHIIRSE